MNGSLRRALDRTRATGRALLVSALRIILVVSVVLLLAAIGALWFTRGALTLAVHDRVAGLTTRMTDMVARTGYFRIRQVTVRGAELVRPESVIAALALPEDADLWDPLRLPALRVQAIPGVLQARVDRRLPNEIVVSVREAAPVGWVRDESGRKLILTTSGEMIAEPANAGDLASLPVITELGDTSKSAITALHHLNHSALAWARGYTAAFTPEGDVKLTLPNRTTVVLPPGPTPPAASLLEAVLADRAASDTTAAARADSLTVDLRFRDLIVVRK